MLLKKSVLPFVTCMVLWVVQLSDAHAQVLRNARVDYYSTDMKRMLAQETGYYINAISQGQIDLDSAMIMASGMYSLSRLLPHNEGYVAIGGSAGDSLISGGHIDQAKKLLKIKAGSDKLRLLFDLASYYLFKPGSAQNDLDSTKVYLDQLEKMTASNAFKNWRNEYLNLSGKFYYQTGNIPEGQNYFEQIVKSRKNANDGPGLGRALATQGIFLPYNSPAKMPLYQQSLALFQKHKLKIPEFQIITRIATIHFVTDHLAAEKDFIKILQMGQALGFRHLQYTHNVMAYLYIQRTNYLKALDHARLSISLMQKTGDQVLKSLYYMRMGDVLIRLDRVKDAMPWYDKAIDETKTKATQIFWYKSFLSKTKLLIYWGRQKEAFELIEEITGTFPPASIFDQMHLAFVKAECYAALKKIPEAEKEYAAFLAIAEHFPAEHIYQEFPNAFIHISRFYFNQKKYKESRLFAQKCFSMATRQKSIGNLSLSHLMFFRLDSVERKYESAIKNFGTYKVLADSLSSIHQKEKYDELLVKYETVKKDQDISKLQQTGISQEAKIRQSDFEKKLILGGVSLLLIFFALLYRQYRSKQKSNIRLEKQQAEISQKNEALHQLVVEKEWLLKEVHHRVKNNLHTIVSLLEHQSDFLTNDALAAIRDSQHRVFSMSLIHQKLYLNENVTTIRFSEYVSELVAYLSDSFNTQHQITFDVRIDPIDLDVSIAIPLGLILNEAVTNAIKYAFPANCGIIKITGTYTSENYELHISDNGVGLPKGFDESKIDSLGYKLMRGLSREVDAEFEVFSQHGTSIYIKLKPKDLQSHIFKGVENDV